MAAIFTLQYGTYTFPNQTFELDGHALTADTPVSDIRRSDGGKLLQGFLNPRKFTIKGKVYSADPGTAHNDLITLQRAAYNGGLAAALQYNGDRNVPNTRLAPEGISAIKTPGLFGYLYDVTLVFVSENPYAQALTPNAAVTGTLNNTAALVNVANNGNFSTRPVFTIVAGSTFTNKVRVDNNANSMFFNYGGPMVNGQTLVVDCDMGCVLLQVGLTMVDSISYFSGNLFFRLEDGGNNALILNGGSFNYSISAYDRYYS